MPSSCVRNLQPAFQSIHALADTYHTKNAKDKNSIAIQSLRQHPHARNSFRRSRTGTIRCFPPEQTTVPLIEANSCKISFEVKSVTSSAHLHAASVIPVNTGSNSPKDVSNFSFSSRDRKNPSRQDAPHVVADSNFVQTPSCSLS